MRRFSQRNSLVTLNDINITPLLDLAFVLLIIFIITTPLLEQGLNLKLPPGGGPDSQQDKNNVKTVEIGRTGKYMFGGHWLAVDQIEKELVIAFRSNPNIFVNIRADQDVPFKFVTDLIDRCNKDGIIRYRFATVPPEHQK